MKFITIYEHESKKLGVEDGFTKEHREMLHIFKAQTAIKSISISGNTINFKQYVGIVHLGDICLEILPKIDKNATDASQWRDYLIHLLQATHNIKLHKTPEGELLHQPDLLLRLYIDIFIDELQKLLRQGLIKQYRWAEGNQPALKGKLLFNKHIQHNAVHQERFFVWHQVYDRDHRLHQILRKALQIVLQLTNDISVQASVQRILWEFPDVSPIPITRKTFRAIQWRQKNAPYKLAISLAKMFLLNYYPNLITKNENVFALLFDMNKLWEEYIYEALQTAVSPQWSVSAQERKKIWKLDKAKSRSRMVRPDLVLTNREDKSTIILDTKWATPKPLQDILMGYFYQLYTYCNLWDTTSSYLIYPTNQTEPTQRGTFFDNKKLSLIQVNILDEQGAFRGLEAIGQYILDEALA